MPTSRSGASSGATIVGLNEFRRELARIGPEWPKALRAVHRVIADEGAKRARARARGGTRLQARAASAIGGKATATSAAIGVFPSAHSDAMANVAFWGAKKHTGWYARFRYSDSETPQHPEWVGNTWDVATATGGPYAINAALHTYLPQLEDEYLDMIDNLARRAFPERH